MTQNYFDDLHDQGFGALGGGAADKLDQVTTKVTPQGIETLCQCGRCGRQNLIAVTWHEVITGSLGYVPPQWNVDQASGTLYPHVGCALDNCRYVIKVGYTPAELKRYKEAGIEQNYMTRQQADGFAAQVQAAAGRR